MGEDQAAGKPCPVLPQGQNEVGGLWPTTAVVEIHVLPPLEREQSTKVRRKKIILAQRDSVFAA